MSTSSNLKLTLELAAKVTCVGWTIGGEAVLLTVPRASQAPKKAVDFLSDEPIEIELEGGLLALDGEARRFSAEIFSGNVFSTSYGL